MPISEQLRAEPDLNDCAFCQRLSIEEGLIARNDTVAAFRDAYPVNPGHSHIVLRRHEPDFFNLSRFERDAMFDLIDEVKAFIEEDNEPDGYNIGINIGELAGQTVQHAHIHVIPRYAGDVEDPRGGIRQVRPDQAPYWDNRTT